MLCRSALLENADSVKSYDHIITLLVLDVTTPAMLKCPNPSYYHTVYIHRLDPATLTLIFCARNYLRHRLCGDIRQEQVAEAQELGSLLIAGSGACSTLAKNFSRNQATGCADMALNWDGCDAVFIRFSPRGSEVGGWVAALPSAALRLFAPPMDLGTELGLGAKLGLGAEPGIRPSVPGN